MTLEGHSKPSVGFTLGSFDVLRWKSCSRLESNFHLSSFDACQGGCQTHTRSSYVSQNCINLSRSATTSVIFSNDTQQASTLPSTYNGTRSPNSNISNFVSKTSLLLATRDVLFQTDHRGVLRKNRILTADGGAAVGKLSRALHSWRRRKGKHGEKQQRESQISPSKLRINSVLAGLLRTAQEKGKK